MTSLRREELIRALPYARRYARALTGSQPRGDSLVAESLQEMLSGPEAQGDPQHALYRAVTKRFDKGSGAASPFVIGRLSQKQRQLLLLTSLEELPLEAAAPIVAIPVKDAEEQLTEAREHLRAGAATDVLIIEDEPVIAMDIEELVQSCGHNVVGVAATEAEAVEMAERTRPGLILADINLGVGGDGTMAVSRIMRHHYAPVIFVTAYPERLLTGEALEPAFVITKPFEPMTLAIATYQAVTGGVHLE
ncbi:MAG TPA: response regulator [Acetobacteraceae bacterium]|jgi:CheY-like chemotaxis protein|nr:response regulator [Acetobacteraceae bacterium]